MHGWKLIVNIAINRETSNKEADIPRPVRC